MEYLKWNHKAASGFKCAKDNDCVKYVHESARRFGGHKQCDTFTCEERNEIYNRQFLEKDTVCVLGQTSMKRLDPFGFPPTILRQCIGKASE